jgi:hypothetical protein
MTDTTNRIINTDAIINELMNQFINNSIEKVRGLYFTNEIDGQEFLLQILSKMQQTLAVNIISLQEKINQLKTPPAPKLDVIESETNNE